MGALDDNLVYHKSTTFSWPNPILADHTYHYSLQIVVGQAKSGHYFLVNRKIECCNLN